VSGWIPDKLPEDLDCERTLIATICGMGAERELAECLSVLRDDDFVHPAHRVIIQAARKLSGKSLEVTPVSMLDAMPEGDRSRAGGFSGIVELLQGLDVAKPMALVEILGRHRKRRELIRLGASLVREAQGGDMPETIADRAAGSLSDIAVNRTHTGLIKAGDCALEVLADLDSDKAPGFRTGFTRLDDVTQGFQPGQIIILAARPGIGKTALALNWTLAIAKQGPVFFFSLEMGRKELMRRMACNIGSISQKAVKERRLTDFQHGLYTSAMHDLSSLPILIDDSASTTVNEIRSHVLRQSTRMGEVPAIVVVDHIGLVPSHTATSGKSEATRIGEISRSMKILAKEAQCPIVILSQLNREVEKADRKPILSDLRDSGCLEQDADIVMFIHRKPKPQMAGGEPDRSASLIISKHRDGELAEIPMEFQGGYCRYEECATRETEVFGRGW